MGFVGNLNSKVDDEIVLLVMGDDIESNSQIASSIVDYEGAKIAETTKAGVRVFESISRKRKIVETRVFPRDDEASALENERLQTARKWISRNSLRRLVLGKLLSVICVCKCPVDCEISDVAYERQFGWLAILGVMFQEHKQAIWILVDIQTIDGEKLASAKQHIDSALNKHGFVNLICMDLSKVRGKDLGRRLSDEMFSRENLMKSIGGDSMYRGEGGGSSEEFEDGRVGPFLLKEPDLPKNPTSPTNTPWGPERVILFGRTGSGKSTLAQMLTKGKLEPGSEQFASDSGVRGQTKQVSCGHGRGWYVVDTPGFGESNREGSTVPTQVAEDRVKKYVKTIDGLYTHFLFVVKKDRIDELEIRLWKFFVCLFGSDINDHFSIVISNADEEWVQHNSKTLTEIFTGCRSFLCAEFPSSQAEDEEWEEELQQIRQESLTQMENSLALLSRNDVVCQFGDLSKTAIMNRRTGSQRHGLGDICRNVAILVTGLCSSRNEKLRVDRKMTLLPA